MIAAEQSSARGCSDCFELGWDDGAPLRVVFASDCCDREAMSWVAGTGGHTGDMTCDESLQVVENLFYGALKTAKDIERLCGNGFFSLPL
ncbi:hypothetical protein [Paraburkholderia saeva]|jgi:putative transposase|uniref:hypothetical protein n=1 Tax=Paraburkholderia saeva TaxID=2777537 RepID=UPI001DE9CDEC|nr:hypothetical protein R70241_05070 [Paraburkholderia saeva]